jgi:hypothetical protein
MHNAIKNNPDSEKFFPVQITGVEELSERLNALGQFKEHYD